MTYHERVLAYEAQGMTTSDAQSVVDVELLKAANHWDCDCDVERNNRTYNDKIDYCRLHKAAPDLLAALRLAAIMHPHNVTFSNAIAQAEGRD